jgi:predicted nucleic acid-binding protein
MILVDTGFLYALQDSDDKWHRRSVELAEATEEIWITTWPVVTEAVYLLMRWLGTRPAIALLEDIATRTIRVWQLEDSAVARLPALMGRYADLPMDLADASLVLLAESLGHGQIATTDERDFRTYRWKNRRPFTNLLN